MASSEKGFGAKTTDFSELMGCHRTTVGHFFKNSKWDSDRLEKELLTISLDAVNVNGKPLFIKIDDTVNPKKRPRSNAKNPMGGTRNVYSHLEHKTTFGHNVFAVMANDTCIKLTLCEKSDDTENDGNKPKTKIEMTVELAQSLPVQTNAYALMDSWYTCDKVVKAFADKGIFTIGALKVNRNIFPGGQKINISEFAKTLSESDFSLVTAKSKKYLVYRYEGKVKGVDNAVVLLSYPEGRFGDEKALRAFLCTDLSLDNQMIVNYYGERWSVEVFFKQIKKYFAFGKYMVRSTNAIKRFFILVRLTAFYCVSIFKQQLGKAVISLRRAIFRRFY